ncbi:DUF1467 family protein [Roseicitreum antarcticum]|uniref:Predicted secreted protein n=1 Tax=Roseicitreum antarcticum TaxID=564137 RepID=A0A1H2XYV4_9RHOB|nr:DUF1467 family protein [Roseicitreum antarcticum]SDW98046.1 Predicted secreted protein [Roseicitreum antarcticum]
MGITSAIVLLAVIWFMVLFIVLPFRVTTQGEAGEVVPGTPSSAPDVTNLKAKFKLVSVIAIVLWCVIYGIVMSGVISVTDLDFFDQMRR